MKWLYQINALLLHKICPRDSIADSIIFINPMDAITNFKGDIIFKGNLDYCLSDNFESNTWLTSFSVCILNETLKTLTLEFWASEEKYDDDFKEYTLSINLASSVGTLSLSPYLISRELFPLNTCVVGVRKAQHFLATTIPDNTQHVYFLCTPDTIINLRGTNAAYVMHQIQFRRYLNFLQRTSFTRYNLEGT